MPRAGSSASITTSAKAAFQTDKSVRTDGLDGGGIIVAPGDGDPCQGFRVHAPAANTATILVSVQPLHKSDEFEPIAAGGTFEYVGVTAATGTGIIEKVTIKSSSGTQSAYWGVMGR